MGVHIEMYNSVIGGSRGCFFLLVIRSLFVDICRTNIPALFKSSGIISKHTHNKPPTTYYQQLFLFPKKTAKAVTTNNFSVFILRT